MNAGLFALTLAYVFSQFFRAFLAVLAIPLERDLGISAEVLSTASGVWFLAFAACQIPIGWALDTLGPKRTSVSVFLIGCAGGATFFGLAQSPWHITAAMALIGVGCSPVLMASYFILSRNFPPARFATLAGLVVAVGSIGNLAASVPMAMAVEALGWRGAMFALAAICVVVSVLVWAFTTDPERITSEEGGSVVDLLKMPAFWFILPLMGVLYAPSVGIRGLWLTPYLSETFAMDTAEVSQAALLMGISMILGSILWGPIERALNSKKRAIVIGNIASLACLGMLMLWPDRSPWLAILLLCGLGFFGATYAVMMAHGRNFVPAHLTGRGVTLMNLFSIGGAGLMQAMSGPVFASSESFPMLFGFFAIAIVLGLAIYTFAPERP